MAIATVNPATGIVEKEYPAHTPEQINEILQRSVAAFEMLRRTTFDQRARWMRAAADLLDAELDRAAALASKEMGKTIGTSRYEVAKCANAMRWYASHAHEYLQDQVPVPAESVNASAVTVTFDPIGPVLAVMPWNYPYWQVVRFAAPALMAGNTGLLKHASNVPQTALYLGELYARAGFPEGAFQTLLIEGGTASELLSDRRIRGVTLTGSTDAGRAVAAAAGKYLKKSVLELGGTDAFIVLPSCDLMASAKAAVASRTQNSGQSCIAGKRFFVHTDVYDEWFQAFTTGMAATRFGDPFDEDVSFGPMATAAMREEAHELVCDALAKGADLHTGGTIPEGPGFYYPATVLTGVNPSMRIFREECFGPVACVYRVSSLDEVIAAANDSDFGLAASVWSTDDAEIERLRRELECGSVFVNGNSASFFGLPFGGVKDSGYGRELGEFGIREFVNVKTYWRA